MTYSTELRTQALDAYLHSGANTSIIATGFGVSPSSLTQWVKAEGAKLRGRGRKRNASPPEKAMHRLKLLAGGMTMEQVGIQTGVSKQAISALAKRWYDLLRDLTQKVNAGATVQEETNPADRPDESHELQPSAPSGILDQMPKETQIEESRSTHQQDHRPTSTSVIREIALSEIDLQHAIQTRRSVNKEKVSEYCERMKAGDHFPPLNVYEVNSLLVTVDGWHRRIAAEDAGLTTVPCMITKGTREEAFRAALMANAVHGLARSNKDKKYAVVLALKEHADWSNRIIADLLKVSHTFVNDLRHQLEADSSSSTGTRTGKDGRKRRVPKSDDYANDSTDFQHAGRDGRDANYDSTSEFSKEGASGEPESETPSESTSVPTTTWEAIKQMLRQAVAPLDASARKEISNMLIVFAESLTAPGREGIVE